MKFKQGKNIKRFVVKNNGNSLDVIFRYPKMSDAKQLLKLRNTTIKETDFLSGFKKLTLKKETCLQRIIFL